MCTDVETSGKIQEMGVLSVMPSLLSAQNSSSAKVANIIAEMAKNGTYFYLATVHISQRYCLKDLISSFS